MNKKNEKRQRVLNASIKVFSKRGYDLATIDEIASKARVSKGTIFFYHRKKNQLIEAAALESVPVEEISNINEKEYSNAEELLECFGLSFFKKYDNPDLRNLFLMAIANKGRYKQINAALRTICFQEMDKMFSKLEELVNAKVPIPIRRAFFGSLLCYVVWWDDNQITPEAYVRTLSKLILQSIK
ncbi:MAG: TetR/AcrR family transcriptional regulator [Thermoplasmatales archaeon]